MDNLWNKLILLWCSNIEDIGVVWVLARGSRECVRERGGREFSSVSTVVNKGCQIAR